MDLRSQSSLWLSALVVVAGLHVLAGCGGHNSGPLYINQDTVDVPHNDAPVITYVSLVLSGSVVEVCYDLADSQEDPIDITPEYSLDGGLTFLSATESLVASPGGVTSDGVLALSSSADGIFHCFVWNAAADGVGTTVPTTVIFRMTGFDGQFPSAPADSGPITIFSPALLVDIGTASGLFGTTNLQVPVDLRAGGTLPANITVTVQFDPTYLVPSAISAVEGPAATAAGAIITSASTTGPDTLVVTVAGGAAMTDGTIFFLAFDALLPAVQVSVATPVLCVAVDAADAVMAPIGAGCGNSGSLLLFPNQPPSCTVTAPQSGDSFTILSGFAGIVTIGYSLVDPEGDPADILIEYTTDGGATWQVPTEIVGPPSAGTTNLATSPAGENHIYVWDAFGDMPTLTAAAALTDLRITPQTAGGGDTGTSCTSGNFTLDLRNAPPTCVQPIATTGGSLDVTITYDITDIEDNPVDILFEYEAPPGSGWVQATPAPSSPVSNPALTQPTPITGGTFIWDSLADGVAITAATAPTDVQFRITAGDPFNPLLPLPPPPNLLVCDTGGTFPIDNFACVFQTLAVLGPLSSLGDGPNTVTGGPTPDDTCTVNTDYSFSLGGPNMGELTDVVSFGAGGNPLVFDIDGQNLTVLVEGTFAGSCAGFQDLTAETTTFGATTYTVNPGPGGPYVQHLGDGTFRSLVTAPIQQGGCDTVDVTFTPNGMGTTGGSDGSPATVTFAACLDYYGWDSASREGQGLLPDGAIDGNMFGQPSGTPAPAVGGTSYISYYGAAPAGIIASAFDIRVVYDPAFLTPDIGYGIQGAATCLDPGVVAEFWTITPNPFCAPPACAVDDTFLINGFRIATQPASEGSTPIATMAFSGVSSGTTNLEGTQEEWADALAVTIPGPQPLPWASPAISSGFQVP
jgi:hypothetical protein